MERLDPPPLRRQLALAATLLLAAAIVASMRGKLLAHEIPDRVFDRAILVSITADQLQVTYDLSITELTLAEELIALIGPGGASSGSLAELLDRYARHMGPLLARGILLRLDGVELPLELASTSQLMETHPRFIFQMQAPLDRRTADTRQLSIEDTNFFLEKGITRIAIRSLAPCQIVSSTAPAELAEVPVSVDWERSPERQDAERRAEVGWRLESSAWAARTEGTQVSASETLTDLPAAFSSKGRGQSWLGGRVSGLLEPDSRSLAIVLLALAFFYGAAHALTPGHGKTVVAAYLVGERGTLRHAVGLGLMTSLSHTGSVLAVALVLALVSPALDQELHTGLSLASGLMVASLGAWLLIARLRPTGSQPGLPARNQPGTVGWGGLLTLGVSGGLVPCWDAVVLLLWAASLRRLAWGFYLLLSFSVGLACVLVVVGVLAVKLGGFLSSRFSSGPVVRALPAISAASILVVGVYLCWLTLQSPGLTATLGSTVSRSVLKP